MTQEPAEKDQTGEEIREEEEVHEKEEELVREWEKESFPASDPPGNY